MKKSYLAALSCILLSPAFAADSEEARNLRTNLDICKAHPAQTIDYEIEWASTKPLTDPVAPEEEARIRELFAKANTPYDKAKHRATYDFILGLVRSRKVIKTRIGGEGDPAAARACLGKLSEFMGIEFKIE